MMKNNANSNPCVPSGRKHAPSRTKRRLSWALIVGGFASVVTPAVEAEAGWRELGLVFVPMHETDDASARSCYTKMRKAIAGQEGEDVVHVRMTRETLQRKLGDATTKDFRTAGKDAFEPLHTWEPTTWRGGDGKVISGGGFTVDAWVLIDCRPADNALDIVTVAPVTGSVMRFHAAGREIDAKLRKLGESFIVAHAWADWSP